MSPIRKLIVGALFGVAIVLVFSPEAVSHVDNTNQSIESTEDDIFTEAQYQIFQENLEKISQELYHEAVIFNGDTHENVVFSPSSISLSLGILYLGSEGETRELMKEKLHLDMDLHSLEEGFSRLLKESYLRESLSEVIVVNQLWVDEKLAIKEDFVDACQAFFHTLLEKVDFFGDSETSRTTINDSIEKSTKGLIQDLLPSGSVDRDTLLVITNALYFKAAWLKKFTVNHFEDTFELISSEKVPVTMMSSTSSYKYGRASNFQVIDIPYEGDYSMVIYYPDDPSTFDYSTIPEYDLSSLSHSKVYLAMPKFKLEDLSLPLEDILKNLGLSNLFTKFSNFNGITSADDLVVSNIFHKAAIEVDENGTEAAAATGVVISERSLVLDTIDVVINHPFIFTINDSLSRHTIFSGVLFNPQ